MGTPRPGSALLLLILLGVSGGWAYGMAPAGELIVGQEYRESLPADQTREFQFPVQADQPYLVEIEQGGLDLQVEVSLPGADPVESDSPLFRDESELFLVEADAPGQAIIHLGSRNYTGVEGQLVVRIQPVSRSGAEDKAKLEALRLMTRASVANAEGTTDSWNTAVEALENANNLLDAAADRGLIARNLYSVAYIEYWQMLNWDRGAQLAAEAAELYAADGESRLAANALHLQAASLIEKANEVDKTPAGGLAPESQALFDQALTLFEDALAVQQRLGHEYDSGQIINNIGMTYYYMGDWDAAVPNFQQAAALFRQIDEWEAEQLPVSNLAVIDFERGRLIQAADSFSRLLELLPPGRLLRDQADTLDNLGATQLALGLLDDSLRSFSNALEIHESIDDRKGQGRSLTGIGVTYYHIGEQELALEYLQAALKATRETNAGRGQVSVLNHIGDIKRQQGDHDAALAAHSEALSLVTSAMDKARVELLVGQDLVAAGRPAEAREMLVETRQRAQDAGHLKVIAGAALTSGDAFLMEGRFDRSLESYRQAVQHYRAMGLDAERAQSQFGLARATRASGELEQAVREAEQAIELIEGLRLRLVDPQMRAFFLASRQDYYAFQIDTLMQLHRGSPPGQDQYLRHALGVSEHSRARSMIDLMAEASVEFPGPVDPALRSRQDQLYQQMAENRYQLKNLLDDPERLEDIQSELDQIQQQMAELENELNLLQIDFRTQNPDYASLSDPEILDVPGIIRQLGDDTALLQYALGEERSYLWLVTATGIRGLELPARAVIEETARSVYERIRVPGYAAGEQAALQADITRLSGQVFTGLDDMEARRLIIVSDGVLQYLPFSVLSLANDEDSSEPLLSRYEIVYVPSLSAMAAQRQYLEPSAARDKDLAIFADPVFGADDPRLQGVTRDVPPGDRMSLDRLPATAYEARAIAELVEPSRRLLATGFEASREEVIGRDLSEYRIIHFATHGLIDSRYPALSALAFSQIDEQGEARDGLLRLHDIYRLELNADLVAMSACSTALGREIRGEGLTGLTQGLMHSGSRSVLASLWQVEDRATAELMKHFYRNLLQKGQKPASALRNAQLELASERRWRNPYFWSAFVLQGDWM